MGTSKDYGGGANWGPVKSEVTQAGGGFVTPQKAEQLVASFVQQMVTAPTTGGFGTSGTGGQGGLGGGGGGGSGGGGGGGGSRGGGGRSSTRAGGSVRGVAQNVGRFFADVSQVGFRAALQKAGLQNIDQMSPREIALALADVLGGDPSLFDETAVRDALTALVQELAENAASLEELGENFVREAQNIEHVLEQFLGNYIFEVFCSTTYKGVLETYGPERAENLAGQVRDFVDVKLAGVRDGRSLADINWASSEGARIVDEIVVKTVQIFGGGAS